MFVVNLDPLEEVLSHALCSLSLLGFKAFKEGYDWANITIHDWALYNGPKGTVLKKELLFTRNDIMLYDVKASESSPSFSVGFITVGLCHW